MKIIVAGTGFVGLTHAAVLSEYGHEVYAYDIDQERLAAYRSADRGRIEPYVNETGLGPSSKVLTQSSCACPRRRTATALQTCGITSMKSIGFVACWRTARMA